MAMGSVNQAVLSSPRAMLHWARRRSEAKDVIGSGVCLRKSLAVQLRRMCDHHGCLPADRPTLLAMTQSLRDNGIVGSCDARFVRRMIRLGAVASRGGAVKPSELWGLIDVLESLLDSFQLDAPKQDVIVAMG
jgi:hypothetical protein